MKSFQDIHSNYLYYSDLSETDIGEKVFPRYYGEKLLFRTDCVRSPFTIFEEKGSWYLLIDVIKDSLFHQFLTSMDEQTISTAKEKNWLCAKKFCFVPNTTETEAGCLMKVKVPFRYSHFEVKVTDSDGYPTSIDDLVPGSFFEAVLELKYYWIINGKVGALWILREVDLKKSCGNNNK